MTYIKRFNLMSIYSRREDEWAEMDDDPNGEWVRWEDIKELIEAMSKIPPKIDIDSGSVDEID